jgi:hypothetical protein
LLVAMVLPTMTLCGTYFPDWPSTQKSPEAAQQSPTLARPAAPRC